MVTNLLAMLVRHLFYMFRRKNRFSDDVRKKERLIQEEQVKAGYFKEKVRGS